MTRMGSSTIITEELSNQVTTNIKHGRCKIFSFTHFKILYKPLLTTSEYYGIKFVSILENIVIALVRRSEFSYIIYHFQHLPEFPFYCHL